MNEKVRIQATKMGILGRISGLTLLNKVRRACIRESLQITASPTRTEVLSLRREVN